MRVDPDQAQRRRPERPDACPVSASRQRAPFPSGEVDADLMRVLSQRAGSEHLSLRERSTRIARRVRAGALQTSSSALPPDQHSLSKARGQPLRAPSTQQARRPRRKGNTGRGPSSPPPAETRHASGCRSAARAMSRPRNSTTSAGRGTAHRLCNRQHTRKAAPADHLPQSTQSAPTSSGT